LEQGKRTRQRLKCRPLEEQREAETLKYSKKWTRWPGYPNEVDKKGTKVGRVKEGVELVGVLFKEAGSLVQ